MKSISGILFATFSAKNKMKATNKRILIGLGLVAAAGIIVYLKNRHRKNLIDELKAEQVSEHGYETAHDVLFPKRPRRIKRYRPKPGVG
jgi:hypothetical protein